MVTLNEFQRETLRKLKLNFHINSLQDIIEILPEFIEEKEIGRFDYELVVRKYEVSYESYDAFDSNRNPFVLISFCTEDEKRPSILDCAFDMLIWCLKEKHI